MSRGARLCPDLLLSLVACVFLSPAAGQAQRASTVSSYWAVVKDQVFVSGVPPAFSVAEKLAV